MCFRVTRVNCDMCSLQLTVPRSPITFDDNGMHVPLGYSAAIDAMRARETADMLTHAHLPRSTPHIALDPKPQTLNPKSQTPNPKPQTPNPKPQSLNLPRSTPPPKT